MKKEITKENPNGKLIMRLYQLCSSSMDQMQALFDDQLKVTKIMDKKYHFSYGKTEFDFSVYKARNELKKEELWILLAARKFLESYKMISKFWEENTYLIEGYVNSCQDGKKVLNSWLEEEIDGIKYVIDINRNLVMKKEDYERIFMPIQIRCDYKEKEKALLK